MTFSKIYSSDYHFFDSLLDNRSGGKGTRGEGDPGGRGPGGNSSIKITGVLVGNFEKNP